MTHSEQLTLVGILVATAVLIVIFFFVTQALDLTVYLI